MVRNDREYIYKLRQEGKSYRAIEKETGVSRGTLSGWFKKLDWSDKQTQLSSEREVAKAPERMKRLNMVRKLKHQFHYAKAVDEAKKLYATNSSDETFVRGIKLYGDHGDLTTKHYIRFTNRDMGKHKEIIIFLQRFLGIPVEKTRLKLYLASNQDAEKAVAAWKESLMLDNEQFHTPYKNVNRVCKSELHFGVGTTIITNTYAKKKLHTLLQLANDK
jgi:transposase